MILVKCTDGAASISLALKELQASLTCTDEKFFSRIVWSERKVSKGHQKKAFCTLYSLPAKSNWLIVYYK